MEALKALGVFLFIWQALVQTVVGIVWMVQGHGSQRMERNVKSSLSALRPEAYTIIPAWADPKKYCQEGLRKDNVP